MRGVVGLIQRLRLIDCVALTLFAACTTVSSHGEWDPLECGDGLDNDGDGKIDCDDPDCWAFRCGSAAPKATTGGRPGAAVSSGAGGHDDGADGLDSGSVGVSRDAQTATTTTKPYEGTARPDAGRDAAQDANRGCDPNDPDCDSGVGCGSGECGPSPSFAGKYILEVRSAVVPDRMLGGLCVDPDLRCGLGVCNDCERPDPYVVVMQNNVVRLGQTSARQDTQTPTWTDARFPIELREPSDTLTFHVWDEDLLTRREIFSCTPKLPNPLPDGELSCEPPSRLVVAPGPSGPYKVVARIMKRQ